MAQLVVRNLEPTLIDTLKKRAAEHGRSAEAEHRAILTEALMQPKKRSFAEALATIPDVGRNEDFNRPDNQENNNRVDNVFN